MRDDEVRASNQRRGRLHVDVPPGKLGVGEPGAGNHVGVERAPRRVEIALRGVVAHLGDAPVLGIGERQQGELDDRVVRPVHAGGLGVDVEPAAKRRVARVVTACGEYQPVQGARIVRVVESAHANRPRWMGLTYRPRAMGEVRRVLAGGACLAATAGVKMS